MLDRYDYEQWENSIILLARKLQKEHQEKLAKDNSNGA
jgi:hypothetical protein